MEALIVFILILIVIIGSIFLIRLLGAWMLRINEIIQLLMEIKGELIKNKDHEYNH